MKKNLPTGMQSFANLRNENYLYVDKTENIFKLLASGRYDKWDWSQQFPVIRLDFGKRSFGSSEELKISLNDFVELTAVKSQISLRENTLSGKFGELIEKLYLATGQQVAVLVDEYDKPITDHLSDKTVQTEKCFY